MRRRVPCCCHPKVCLQHRLCVPERPRIVVLDGAESGQVEEESYSLGRVGHGDKYFRIVWIELQPLYTLVIQDACLVLPQAVDPLPRYLPEEIDK